MRSCAAFAVGLLALALLPATRAGDADAEKLFRNLEKKLKEAKVFEIDFTYQLEGKTTRGTLLLTSDNKARLKLRGPFFFGVKQNADFELVSDGKQLKTKGAKFVMGANGQVGVELGGQMEQATPKSFHAALVATVSRGGMGATVLGLPYAFAEGSDPDGAESRMKVHDFQTGGAEKVGERQAKLVRYRYGKGGNDDPVVIVWIDTETGLPLKRVLQIHPESEKIRITETYREIKVDPKVDARAFELPK